MFNAGNNLEERLGDTRCPILTFLSPTRGPAAGVRDTKNGDFRSAT